MLRKVSVVLLIIVVCSAIAYAQENAVIAEKLEQIERINQQISIEDEKNVKNRLYNEISEIYSKLINQYPENDDVFCDAAAFYSDWGEEIEEEKKASLNLIEKGLEYANRAVDLNGQNGRAYFYRGALRMQRGARRGIFSSLRSIRPMRDDLLRSIELHPDFSPAYHGLAVLYLEAPGWPLSVGDQEEALRYRIKSLELEPDNFEYRLALAYNYKELGEEDMFRATLLEILNLEANNNDPDHLEYVRGVQEEAEQELEQLGYY